MTETEELLWIWYSLMVEIPWEDKKIMLDAVENQIEKLYTFDDQTEEILNMYTTESKYFDLIRDESRKERAKKHQEIMNRKEIRIIPYTDKDYPEKLLNIYDFPIQIYVYGNLPKQDKIAIGIVGARLSTSYGNEITEKFARDLSSVDVEIISGLARGIDGRAHWGAVKNGKPTYSVLGCGVDVIYPRENEDLYYKILEGQGGIISEYPMGFAASKITFPPRNRIISGLSDGVLVVEAKDKSGSLITANHALEQGKNVYAVPGRIGDVFSEGTNRIIQAGAKLVLNAQDIMDDFPWINETLPLTFDSEKKISLATNEKIVYSTLSLLPKHISEIAIETKTDVKCCMVVLNDLEHKGLVKQVSKNHFILSIS